MGKDDSIRTICKTIGSLSSRVEQPGPHIRQPVTVLCPLIRVPDVIDPLPWDALVAGYSHCQEKTALRLIVSNSR